MRKAATPCARRTLGDRRSAGVLLAGDAATMRPVVVARCAMMRRPAVGPDLSRRWSPRCVETLHVLPRWLSLPRFERAGCDVRASCPRAAPNAKYPRNAMTTASRAHRPVIAATALMTLLMLVCTACGAAPHPTATVRSCNGSSTLCSRPLNEVIFPGTHNSFAASNEPGWYFAKPDLPDCPAAPRRHPGTSDRYPLRRL